MSYLGGFGATAAEIAAARETAAARAAKERARAAAKAAALEVARAKAKAKAEAARAAILAQRGQPPTGPALPGISDDTILGLPKPVVIGGGGLLLGFVIWRAVKKK